jgi:hypothetical protein
MMISSSLILNYYVVFGYNYQMTIITFFCFFVSLFVKYIFLLSAFNPSEVPVAPLGLIYTCVSAFPGISVPRLTDSLKEMVFFNFVRCIFSNDGGFFNKEFMTLCCFIFLTSHFQIASIKQLKKKERYYKV